MEPPHAAHAATVAPSRPFRPRPLLFLASSLVAGSLAAPFFDRSGTLLWTGLLVLFAACLAASILRRPPALLPMALFFLLGALIARPVDAEKSFALLTSDREGASVSTIGRCSDFPSLSDGEYTVVVEAELQHDGNGWVPARGAIRLRTADLKKPFRPGERVAFTALPRKPHSFRNPGGFDYEQYLAAQSIGATARLKDDTLLVSLGGDAESRLLSRLSDMRRRFGTLCETVLDQPARSLMQTLIIGERGAVPRDVREGFHASGLGHLLAISGLHMGIAAFGTYAVLLWLLKRSVRLCERMNVFGAALAGAVLPLVFYTALSGMSLSALRASIMVAAFMIGFFLSRSHEPVGGLALAAVAVIVFQPTAPRDAAFQLSFGSVAGILLLLPRVAAASAGGGASFVLRCGNKMVSWFAITGIAYLVTAPIIAYHFNRVSLIAVAMNLWAIPLMGLWVIPLGLASAFAFPLLSEISGVLLRLAALPLPKAAEIIRRAGEWSFASTYTPSPTLPEGALWYGAIVCLVFFRRRIARVVLVGILLAGVSDAAYWGYLRPDPKELTVTYMDVGQGNAAFLQLPGGATMMVDGGGFSGTDFDTGEKVIAPYLWRNRIMHVDYLVNSHPHPDHVNGLVFLARHFPVRELWVTGVNNPRGKYAELLAVAKERNIRIRTPADAPLSTAIGDVRVEALAPTTEFLSSLESLGTDGYNDGSLVVRVTYGDTAFLFPGDLERKGEEALLASCGDIRSDVLLCPHHGSGGSSTPAFVKAVAPKIAVISVGPFNPWGLPHETVIHRYREAGCGVYRTDRDGAVTVVSDGRRTAVSTTRGENEDSESPDVFSRKAQTLMPIRAVRSDRAGR